MSKFQSAGSSNGDAKISLLVLNDDIRVHSSGTMMSRVQKPSTTWETVATTLSPAGARSGLVGVSVAFVVIRARESRGRRSTGSR